MRDVDSVSMGLILRKIDSILEVGPLELIFEVFKEFLKIK
jgi:hypothetical protein